MTQYAYPNEPLIRSIFHPSDFSLASEYAFDHALALALILTTKFTILHAGKKSGSWRHFPAVRSTLERWNFLQPGSDRSVIFEEFELKVKKVNMAENNPTIAIMKYLKEHSTDLIVLATEGREGMPRWLQPSVAEKIAQKSKTKTLFVPNGAKGFVSHQTGEINLNRILVPVDSDPDAWPAIDFAARTARLVGNKVEIILLHIGTESTMPAFNLRNDPAFHWKRLVKSGDVLEIICASAEQENADLIVMSTEGRHGFLDALRGSVTEQVIHHSPCAVLAVPIN